MRQKAKDITNLLIDESRLREARRNRASMRDRMMRGDGGEGFDEDEPRRSVEPIRPRQRTNRDEDELRKAIEASKASFSAEQGKSGAMTAEERNMLAAIKMSEEEEEKRRKKAEDDAAKGLFDDS